MTDEEWKAIEYLKQNNIVEIQYDNYGLESIHRVGIDEKQTILNLIEKQQKEIEELKDTRSIFNMGRRSYKNEIEDKIKAKIEEIDKVLNEDIYVIDGHYDDRYYRYLQDKHILQSLLEKE